MPPCPPPACSASPARAAPPRRRARPSACTAWRSRLGCRGRGLWNGAHRLRGVLQPILSWAPNPRTAFGCLGRYDAQTCFGRLLPLFVAPLGLGPQVEIPAREVRSRLPARAVSADGNPVQCGGRRMGSGQGTFKESASLICVNGSDAKIALGAKKALEIHMVSGKST